MSNIGLGLRLTAGESWRDAVKRISNKYGMEQECLESFDAYVAAGDSESEAAWCALYDWDSLDMYVDGKPAQ